MFQTGRDRQAFLSLTLPVMAVPEWDCGIIGVAAFSFAQAIDDVTLLRIKREDLRTHCWRRPGYFIGSNTQYGTGIEVLL
jgi:hypothetical protein